MNDLDERLVRCFTTVFDDLQPSSAPEASSETMLTWDSMAIATLVSVVEEEFGVSVPPETVDRFTSYASISEWLRSTGTRF
jgi:acyl carrier protein